MVLDASVTIARRRVVWSAILGLPAIRPAPASATSSSTLYLCFFEPNDAELSPRSRTILGQLLSHWRRAELGEHRSSPSTEPVPPTEARVELAGHADRAEELEGNATVSARRAAAVVAFLVAEGIPADRISALSFGADRLLLPSDAAEPVNRRVELTVRS